MNTQKFLLSNFHSPKLLVLATLLFPAFFIFSQQVLAAPSITGGNITVSGNTGNLNTYIVGDTLTVSWDAGADGNVGTILSAEVNVSDWGGPSNLAMSDTTACGGTAGDDVFEACYVLVAGNIDNGAIDQRVFVTATDAGGSTGPIQDDQDSTVDIRPPVFYTSLLYILDDAGVIGVAAPNFGITPADTISAEPEVTDPDGDTLSWDATPVGGLVNETFGAVVTIQAGSVDDATFGFDFTATDDAGNITTTNSEDMLDPDPSFLTLSIDNELPTPTVGCISVTGATGTGGAFKNGDSPVATLHDDNPGGGCTDNYGDIASIDFDASNFNAIDTALAGSNASNVWTASLSGVMDAQDDTNNNISLVLVDDAGNTAAVSGTNNYVIDTIAPIITDNGALTITTDNGTVGRVGVNGGLEAPDKVTQTNATVSVADGDTTTIDLTALTGQGAVAGGVESGEVIPGALESIEQLFTVTVTDDAGNTATVDSDDLDVDNLLPVLAEVTPVPDPTTDATPDYTFSSTEAGDIGYAGACASASTAAALGSNTITLAGNLLVPFSLSTFSNCTLTVTDSVGNVSETLAISPFTVEEVGSPDPEPTPQTQSSGGGGGYPANFPCKGLSAEACQAKLNPSMPTPAVDENVPPPTPLELPSCSPQAILPFKDMQGHWAVDPVSNLYYRCVVDGKTPTTFLPDSAITRAELLKMVVLAFQVPLSDSVTQNPFYDVQKEQWYALYIQSAKDQQVADGYENGNFAPDQWATLAEALKLTLSGADLKPLPEMKVNFSQQVKNEWFYPYVQEALERGLIANEQVDFYSTVSRAQAAEMISTLIEKVVQEKGMGAVAASFR